MGFYDNLDINSNSVQNEYKNEPPPKRVRYNERDGRRVVSKPFIPPIPEPDAHNPLLQFRKLSSILTRRYEDRVFDMGVHSRLDVSTNLRLKNRQCAGDIRMRKIRYWLDHFPGYERSDDQRVFHENFIVACLPKIYGKDWESESVRVMNEMKVKKIHYEVLAQTPRRFGKTIAVAMFMAVVAAFVPGIRIPAYSTGKRASGMLMGSMKKFMKFIEGGSVLRRIIKQNHEELFLADHELPLNKGPGSAEAKRMELAEETTKIYSYPSSVKGF